MPNKYFKYSVIFLLLFELIMLLTTPANGSFFKLLVTLLFVASFVSLLMYFIKNFEFHRIVFKPIFPLLLALLGLGLVNIVRSFQLDFQTLITLFGNINTGFAMLLPLAIILGSKFENMLWFNGLSIKILKLGLILVPLSLLLYNDGRLLLFQLAFILLPIALFAYQKRTDKVIIVVNSIIMLAASVLFSGRLSALQITFLWMGIFLFYIYRQTRWKKLRNYVLILIVSFPFVILLIGFPIFDLISSNIESVGGMETIDTRTFLYQEVIEDLTKSNDLLWGRAAMGKYYSGYFAQGVAGGDNENRINVEVGVLSMLLKGGIVTLVFNFAILLAAIFLSLRSKNVFTQRLVFLVITHMLSLFIADIPQYTTLSFAMWIAIGACVSFEVRSKNEKQILMKFKTYKIKYAKPKNIYRHPVV